MEVFRIARKKHCRDLSGEGVCLFGGRWNKRGVSSVYISQQASLAALEVLDELGTKWILSQNTLLLKVPSVLIETENNILINSEHLEIENVKITSVSSFNIDDRLIK